MTGCGFAMSGCGLVINHVLQCLRSVIDVCGIRLLTLPGWNVRGVAMRRERDGVGCEKVKISSNLEPVCRRPLLMLIKVL